MRISGTAAATAFLVAAASACATAPHVGSSSTAGEWREGEVEAAAGFPVLVRRGGARAVVALERVPVLGGIDDPRRLREGDRIRYRVVREEHAIEIADVVELLPARTTAPEQLARVAEVGDDPGVGGWLPVDARPAELFAGGHLAGARSMPPEDGWRVARRLGVPRTVALLFYGADEFASEPFEAARAAIAEGYSTVRVLQGGLRAWREAGRPTFVSAAALAGRSRGGTALLDVRPRSQVERGAIPGSISIPVSELRADQLSGRPWWPTLVLVGRDGEDPDVAAALASIRMWRGLGEQEKAQPIQVLEGGFAAWIAAGGRPGGVETLADPGRLGRFDQPEIVDRAEFDAAWASAGGDQVLLDVRSGMKREPPFVRNIPLETLAAHLHELPRDREILVYCASGRRSAVAREILARNGFRARSLRDNGPVP